MSDPSVVRNETESRYEIALDGERIGFADVVERDGVVVVPHTEIDPAQEGNGYGSVLVRHLLDDVRERGLRVVPACPFVRVYIDRHPEYADLVA